MRKFLALWLLGCASLAAQQLPSSTELPGKPFFITKTWTIGGEGNWDRLTIDPQAGQLFIAHGPAVQVVDIETGEVVGQIDGLGDAHSVALDDTGQFGYIGDAKAAAVVVFDRHTFQVTARIQVASSPRLVVYDPSSNLLFALAYNPPPEATQRRVVSRDANGTSRVTLVPDLPSVRRVSTPVEVIDTQTQSVAGRLLFSGRLDAALNDGLGSLFIAVTDRNYVLRVNAHTVATMLQSQAGSDSTLDWSDIGTSDKATAAWAASNHPDIYFLDSACTEPRGLAVDGRLDRLYAACNNMKLIVWNMRRNQLLASLPLSAPPDTLAYDPDRNLLFAASGNGSLTVIRQHVTETYSTIQELPTRQQARTLAVNPGTGEIYLVSNALGVDLSKPGGIGKLKTIPVPGSFQVLVVGN